jgi:hypothetical protein
MATNPTPVPTPEAFTIKSQAILNRIITDISVSAAFDPANPPATLPPKLKARALWDTGATNSVVSHDIAQQLNLPSMGVANVDHGGGTGTSPRRVVNLELPHGVGFIGVLVTEFPPPKDGAFNVIVGMDIITVGDFTVTNVNGQTWVSFRTPSSVQVDYVSEINKAKFAGVARNAPCPCRSGEKFKRCHGR